MPARPARSPAVFTTASTRRWRWTVETIAAFGCALACVSALAAELRVLVDTGGDSTGTVMVAVYDSAGNFRRQAIEQRKQPAASAPVVLRFAGLAPGDHAVGCFQDLNGNGELDTNLFGVPTEPYGFSRDARGRLSAPGWDDVRFPLPSEGSTMTIRVR